MFQSQAISESPVQKEVGKKYPRRPGGRNEFLLTTETQTESKFSSDSNHDRSVITHTNVALRLGS